MKQYFFIIFAILCFVSTSCNNSEKGDTKQKGLYLVATTGMIKDAVMNVVKDKAEVVGLMGAGVDPHLYKATQSDLTKLTQANAVFYNGLFLEGKMGEVLEKLARQKPVIAVTDEIDRNDLLSIYAESDQSTEQHLDPHVWFDVAKWQKVVTLIGQKMQEIDAPNATFYAANTAAYIEKLKTLEQKVQANMASLPNDQRILITSHDAFGYFGKAYNMEVRGLQGVSTVSEFGLKDVKNLVDYIVEKKVKAVFIESSVPQKPLEAVLEGCKQKGQEVVIGGTLFSDAMGSEGTVEGTYIGMVESNVKTIVEALR